MKKKYFCSCGAEETGELHSDYCIDDNYPIHKITIKMKTIYYLWTWLLLGEQWRLKRYIKNKYI